MPNISCIIPTCNRNKFLLDAINSVLEQSFAAYEILIINNGKSEITLPPEIEKKVKIFNIIPFAGAAQARNFGASLAEGDCLAFLDDDDLWNKDYLKNAGIEINQGSKCIISRLDQYKNEKITKYKNADGKVNLKNLLTYNPGITGSNIVISKKLFFQVGGFNPKLPPSEDKSIVVELLLRNENVAVLPSNQAIIRQHGGERLYNPKNAAEGVFQFLRKYSEIMTRQQKIHNQYKIYNYLYLSGEKKYILHLIFYKFLNRIWVF